MNYKSAAIAAVKQAAQNLLTLSQLPDNKLGVGPNPTQEEAAKRRAWYTNSHRHMAGPLTRKAERVKTRQQARRLAALISRHDSSIDMGLFF